MTPLNRFQRLREGSAWLTNGTLCLLGTGLVLLARQFVAENSHFGIGFSGVSLLSATLYLTAVLLVRTQPVNRATFGIVIGFAVAMHAMTYFADPFESSDIYRYVWDGIVQHVHINPYRYVPGNPALTFLREPNQDIFDNINRRDYAPTIYPPVAQMLYWVATFFSPTVAAMKMLMLGFEALAAGAMILILRLLKRPRAEILLFLWCPLLVWQIGDGGHVDAAICGFLALAFLFRLRERPWLTGLFLGLAIMTKFYPMLLLPALYQRRDWKMPATVAAICVFGYACYASVGLRVFGFLSGYTKEEGLDTGARYFLLDFAHQKLSLANLPNAAFLLFSALVLVGLALWAWRYATPERFSTSVLGPVPTPAFLKASAMLAFAMMLLFSPHYAWYLMWLVPFMALAPGLSLFVYVLGFFYGYTTGLAAPGPKMFVLNERLYLAVAIAAILQLALRRWPVMYAFTSKDRLSRPNEDLSTQVLSSKPLN